MVQEVLDSEGDTALMNKWRNSRYRHWRWNKVKHSARTLVSAQYRAEMMEYYAWLEKEKEEVRKAIRH